MADSLTHAATVGSWFPWQKTETMDVSVCTMTKLNTSHKTMSINTQILENTSRMLDLMVHKIGAIIIPPVEIDLNTKQL